MRHASVISLALLFLTFSFNAYACLLPIFPTTDGSMEQSCPSSDQSASSLFCDMFKTLEVSSPDKADVKGHEELLEVSTQGLLTQVLSPARERNFDASRFSTIPAAGHISVLRL